MTPLYCACCGRPFARTSPRGPAPLYCSRDCRLQIATRRRVWTEVERKSVPDERKVGLWDRMRAEWTRPDPGFAQPSPL
ncbi:hypothetical protein [Azospirillum doebereinerae]|uniref:Uncharacterized protein n=1 Tax=Azospirillum doebereinerae TaxID=92933 RepID=A0A3S0V939_9PROT|nr:hypothetical protein [Azospirillum doebereinerae]MCG5241052.1 hypothetical protein [Azospirillum doebereinerae]RUQ76035.1 hypothetical protein EJ913_02690 [Azospirillum doebereinerae]